jgi:hypothetical protein
MMDLPPALSGGFTLITGTASDLPTEGRVLTVAVQLDSDTAPWQLATVYAPDDTGEQDWLWTWNLPVGVEGDIHRLRVQAGDLVGNVSGPSAWEEVIVDTVAPVLTITKLITYVHKSTPVLSGTIRDGYMSGITVTAHINTPSGGYYSEGTDYNAGAYTYTLALNPAECGIYTIYLEGRDLAGNSTKQGPFQFMDACAVGGVTTPVSALDMLLLSFLLTTLTGLILISAVAFARKRAR